MADLSFVIGLVDKISPPLQNIGAEAEKLGSRIKKAFPSIANAAKRAAKAVGAMGAAIAANTVVFNSAADKAGKFAQRIGKSVEELTAYRHAAELSGVASGTFDMALQRMNRRVGQAIGGTGEAVKVLDRFNINAREFGALPISEQLGIMSDKMQGVSSQQEKLAIAMALFDTEGVAMLQMLENGSEGMSDMAREAERLGLVINDKAAKNAALFNDNMNRMTSSIKGVSSAIAQDMTPLFSGAMKLIADKIVELRPIIRAFFNDLVDGFFFAAAITKQVLENIYNNIFKVFTDPEAFDRFLTGLKNTVIAAGDFMYEAVKLIGIAWFNMFKIIGNTGKAVFDYLKQVIKAAFTGGDIPPLSELVFKGIPEATEKARGDLKTAVDDVFNHYAETGEGIATGLANLVDLNVDAAQQTAQAWKSSVEEIGTAVAETGEKVKEGLVETKSAARMLIDEYIAANKAFTEEFSVSMAETFTRTIDNLSGAMSNAIMAGTSVMDAFKQVAKAAAGEVLKALIQIGIRKLILAKLFAATNKSKSAGELATGFAATFTNAFASTAAIPIVGPAMAPGVATASLAAVKGGAAAAMAAGAAMGVAGVSHGGLTNVPREGTYLLDRGERVVKRRQNEDLTQFLAMQSDQGAASGPSITIQSINQHILPNATNVEAIANLSTTELRETIGMPLISAIEEALLQGYTPEFVIRETS